MREAASRVYTPFFCPLRNAEKIPRIRSAGIAVVWLLTFTENVAIRILHAELYACRERFSSRYARDIALS